MRDVPLAADLQHYLEDGKADARRGNPALRGWADTSDRELIRLGRLLELDLSQAVVLVLKGQWEKFRSQRGHGKDARDLPGGPHMHREFHAGASGTADPSELFRLFEEEAQLATARGYDGQSFETLVHHSILLRLQTVSFHGPEVRAFAASQRAQQALLCAATPAEREAFWDKHRSWREIEQEVGSLLLEVETQALENRRIESQWMEAFGSAYLPLLEAEARTCSLQRRIERKTENPLLTLEELEHLEATDRHQMEREMARLRRAVARSRIALLSGPGGMPLDDLEALGYEDECRRLLREIYRLTHPDVVGHHGFTDLQRDRLIERYREAVACAETAGLEDEEIALGMRSLAALEGILARVQRVWEVMGLDVNEGAALCGDTLAERMLWLDARIAELAEQAKQVRADLLTLATDADVGEKRACLRSRSQIAAILEEMERSRQGHESQVPGLESRLLALFADGSDGDQPPA